MIKIIRSIIADTMLYWAFRMYPPGPDAERLGKFMGLHYRKGILEYYRSHPRKPHERED